MKDNVAVNGGVGTQRQWRLALRYGVISIFMAAASLSLIVIGALFTSGLAGSEARDFSNRAYSAAFFGAGVALLGIVPWVAVTEGHRGPWRVVAFVLFAAGGVLALTTVVGITVPH